MNHSALFTKWTATLGIVSLAAMSPLLHAEDSVAEKVSDAAKEAWSATKQTAKKVENTIEKKVDEMRSEDDAVAPKGNKVAVTLSEYLITMPSAIPAGLTTFVVTNEGKEKHGFEIDGKTVEQELSKPLQPGESARLTVDLPAGKYEIECPVSNNDDKGMKRELIVQ